MQIDLEKERLEILKRYRKLLRTAKPFLKDDDAKQIKKAFLISAEAHKEMRRKSGEPYIYHPLAVAQICVEEIGLGTTSIISALLHDVVEDTDTTLADIEKQFNPKIASIIDGLTKIAGTFEYGTSQQAENFPGLSLFYVNRPRLPCALFMGVFLFSASAWGFSSEGSISFTYRGILAKRVLQVGDGGQFLLSEPC